MSATTIILDVRHYLDRMLGLQLPGKIIQGVRFGQDEVALKTLQGPFQAAQAVATTAGATLVAAPPVGKAIYCYSCAVFGRNLGTDTNTYVGVYDSGNIALCVAPLIPSVVGVNQAVTYPCYLLAEGMGLIAYSGTDTGTMKGCTVYYTIVNVNRGGV